jgi:hypothetical protein
MLPYLCRLLMYPQITQRVTFTRTLAHAGATCDLSGRRSAGQPGHFRRRCAAQFSLRHSERGFLRRTSAESVGRFSGRGQRAGRIHPSRQGQRLAHQADSRGRTGRTHRLGTPVGKLIDNVAAGLYSATASAGAVHAAKALAGAILLGYVTMGLPSGFIVTTTWYRAQASITDAS